MAVPIDMTGKRYGRLTTIALARKVGYRAIWKFHCDCGRTVEARGDHVRYGATTSCGCFQAEGNSNRRHGRVGSPEYRTWTNMLTRCTNPKSKDWLSYGGRGVTVCERWRLFENFFADMGERPEGTTIDRIDVNDGYRPGNCRWASAIEQRANRRDSRRAA